MLWLGIVQAVVFSMLSVANFALAYRIYKLQRDRNTAKLVITSDDLIEDDEHEAYALRVYNVGLVPAVGVHLWVDVEDWKNGEELTTEMRESYFAYHDSVVQLSPQDFTEYELPALEDRSLIITAVTTCANGIGDEARFMLSGLEPDPIAFRQVRARRKSAINRLKSRKRPNAPRFMIGANSLKDHGEMSKSDIST